MRHSFVILDRRFSNAMGVLLVLITSGNGSRLEEKYKMLRPAAVDVETEHGTRYPEGLSLSWELANIATGSAWTVAGLLDGVRCLRRGVQVRSYISWISL